MHKRSEHSFIKLSYQNESLYMIGWSTQMKPDGYFIGQQKSIIYNLDSKLSYKVYVRRTSFAFACVGTLIVAIHIERCFIMKGYEINMVYGQFIGYSYLERLKIHNV